MQLYFVKATYSKNVYKIGDFFLNGAYKLVANKMLNINSRIPNDGNSFFITSNLELPDTTDIREHTHVIVPEYNKIFKIINSQYINAQQYQLNLEEDALIGNYIELEEKNIILQRTNDVELFRGQNDVSDLSLKETVETKVIQSVSRTGKWALLFMQVDPDKTRLGLKFKDYNAILGYEQVADLTTLYNLYPEINTEEPSKIEYFQRKVFVADTLTSYQCVYGEVSGLGKLFWMKYEETITPNTDFYFNIADAVGVRFVDSDIRNVVIALPFESVIKGSHATNDPNLLTWNRFVGPIDTGELIDIKIVDDIILPFNDVTYIINTSTDKMEKTLQFDLLKATYLPLYADDTTVTEYTDFQSLSILHVENEIDLDPDYFSVSPSPINAEPFYKYELYIFGQRFSIPYYLTGNIKLLIAINSGVINYTIYYIDKRNIIASGSFTNSAKYQVDQLDAFYNQNPTYKDQFYLKMGGNLVKGTAGGAFAGSLGGPLGLAGGAAVGAVTATVDAGLSYANLKYMEKGLILKPDQIFGDISDTALALLNIFAIYWVKKIPENKDLMLQEYYLRGFPTSYVESIDDLDYEVNTLFGTAKVVFGEIKEVIRNEFTTKYINDKLKEGIILVP